MFFRTSTPPPCAMSMNVQVEDDYVELAKTLMEKAEAKGVKFLLPEDVVVADKASALRQQRNCFCFCVSHLERHPRFY